MSAEAQSIAQSQLDLYDFFSVLLPGVYVLILLIPLVPRSLPLGTVGSAVVLLVGGYVTGRGLHTAAYSYDEKVGFPSNRDTFINAIKDSDVEILSPELRDQFYGVVKADSGFSLPYDRQDADNEELRTLYVYVRSQLYQHGNARAQSFQAIYAFYRSAHFATIIVALCYVGYAAGQSTEYWENIGEYSTYMGQLGIEASDIIFFAEILFFVSLITLKGAKSDYKQYYLQYLMTDYINMKSK